MKRKAKRVEEAVETVTATRVVIAPGRKAEVHNDGHEPLTILVLTESNHRFAFAKQGCRLLKAARGEKPHD